MKDRLQNTRYLYHMIWLEKTISSIKSYFRNWRVQV